jgi:hypothetical protein
LVQILFAYEKLFSLCKYNIIYTNNDNEMLHAKAGHIDHIWPIRLKFTYIPKQQILNSGLWWSK